MLIFFLLGNTIGLFVWYLLAMFVLRRRKALRKKNVILYWALLIPAVLGILLDVWYNFTLATLIFFKFPKVWFSEKFPWVKADWTLTMRLSRYRKGTGWRLRWADFICERILNPFAPIDPKTGKPHHC